MAKDQRAGSTRGSTRASIKKKNYEDYSRLDKCLIYFEHHWHGIVIVATPIVCLYFPYVSSDQANRCMYVFIVMCVYFVTGVMPFVITAMLPIIAFPIMDIMTTEQVCRLYFKDSLVMFTSYIASAIEYSGLHIRVAYRMLKIIGCSPRRLHFGLCAMITFASMWISNTASTMMMMGIVDAMLNRLSEQGICKLYDDEDDDDDDDLPLDERRPSRVKTSFFLAVAYSTSIGGGGSFLGSPSNLIVNGIYHSHFQEGTTITFGYFTLYSFPILVVVSALMAINLQVLLMGLFRPNSKDARALHATEKDLMEGQQHIEEQYAALGPITTHEILVLVLFLVMILLYITRNPNLYTGWADYLAEGYIRNTPPVVAVLILMFALPANLKFLKFREEESLEKTPALNFLPFALSRVPWTLIFLVGGGTALAEGSKISGMACKVGRSLKFLHNVPTEITLLFVLTVEILLTNFVINATCAHLTIPIVAEIAGDLSIHPLWMLLPANLCLNMPFILSAGTLPNVLVRNYAGIRKRDMALAGLVTTITSIVAIFILTQVWGVIAHPEIASYPQWAKEAENRSHCFD